MTDHKVFKTKYYGVVDIFKNWIPDGYNFTDSTILDFGCEHGIMSLGFALRLKAKKVIGVDINNLHTELIDMAREVEGIEQLPQNLEFHQIYVGEPLSNRFKCDIIFSWSTFEHILQTKLDLIVRDLYNLLNFNGFALIQIAPLYFSAYGSHLESLNFKPWSHLIEQSDLFHNDVLNVPKVNSLYESESDENFQK